MSKTTDRAFNPSGSTAIDAIKSVVAALEETIRENTPEGRRQSLALTHLETAAMYAVKSAAVGDE